MGAPKRRLNIRRIPTNTEASGRFIEAGTCESLLISLPHHRLPSGAWSGGGPFYQVTEKLEHTGGMTFPGYYLNGRHDDPYRVCGVNTLPTLVPQPSLSSYMSTWGNDVRYMWTFAPSGFRKTRPGNPVASLGQFIVELRDLPKLPFQGRRSYRSVFGQGLSLPGMIRALMAYCMDFRHLGGEYLNVVFGWKPFIRDLQQVYNLWQTIDRQLAQIVRNNGKGIRRRATVSENSSSTSAVAHSASAGAYVASGFPSGTTMAKAPCGSDWSVETKVTTKVWYAAKYRYFIPDVSSSQWTRKAKLALFGVLPTPELVWAVTPWSWLIDWSVNVSDVLSNMSTNAVENLVQDYSFLMMREETVKTGCVSTYWGDCQYGSGSCTLHSTYSVVKKRRTTGGSPYALNAISGKPLTAYQGGILAALGLSLAK